MEFQKVGSSKFKKRIGKPESVEIQGCQTKFYLKTK